MKKEPAKTKVSPRFVKIGQQGQHADEIGRASKPISFHPVKFEDAVSSLLKIKPPVKAAK
jgi:hypothetical protein